MAAEQSTREAVDVRLAKTSLRVPSVAGRIVVDKVETRCLVFWQARATVEAPCACPAMAEVGCRGERKRRSAGLRHRPDEQPG